MEPGGVPCFPPGPVGPRRRLGEFLLEPTLVLLEQLALDLLDFENRRLGQILPVRATNNPRYTIGGKHCSAYIRGQSLRLCFILDPTRDYRSGSRLRESQMLPHPEPPSQVRILELTVLPRHRERRLDEVLAVLALAPVDGETLVTHPSKHGIWALIGVLVVRGIRYLRRLNPQLRQHFCLVLRQQSHRVAGLPLSPGQERRRFVLWRLDSLNLLSQGLLFPDAIGDPRESLVPRDLE